MMGLCIGYKKLYDMIDGLVERGSMQDPILWLPSTDVRRRYANLVWFIVKGFTMPGHTGFHSFIQE